MIRKIVALLQYERSNTPIGKKPTDGLRFYFVNDEKSPVSKTALMLVSTREFEPTPTQKDKTHDDYYDHTSALADDLFKDPMLLTIQPAPERSRGTALYDSVSSAERYCAPNRNYISREDAHNMVAHFKTKGLPFSTRAEWFHIDLLESFIADPEFSGLRIYLGRLPSNVGRLADHAALVLSPTHIDSSGQINTDFFNCSITIINNGNKGLSRILDGYNNGELCPNNCH
jgi:hypothetical protein